MKDVDNIDCGGYSGAYWPSPNALACRPTKALRDISDAPLQRRLQNDAEHGMKSELRNGSLGDVRDAFAQLVRRYWLLARLM